MHSLVLYHPHINPLHLFLLVEQKWVPLRLVYLNVCGDVVFIFIYFFVVSVVLHFAVCFFCLFGGSAK